MIKESRFVIAVPDLTRSADFYEKVLGFSIEEFGDPGWRLFRKDGCRIMAGECPDALPLSELGIIPTFVIWRLITWMNTFIVLKKRS